MIRSSSCEVEQRRKTHGRPGLREPEAPGCFIGVSLWGRSIGQWQAEWGSWGPQIQINSTVIMPRTPICLSIRDFVFTNVSGSFWTTDYSFVHNKQTLSNCTLGKWSAWKQWWSNLNRCAFFFFQIQTMPAISRWWLDLLTGLVFFPPQTPTLYFKDEDNFGQI